MNNDKITMAAVALGAGALLALAAPLSATAHDSVVSSTPEEGQTLAVLPAEFSVTTNEPLLALAGNEAGFALQIVDSEGHYYGDGCVTIVDATLSSAAALGAAGDYTLLWQVVSSDGHAASGAIAFTWAPSDSAEASTGSAQPPVCSEGTGASSTPVAVDDEDHSAHETETTDGLWIGGAITGALILGLVAYLVVRSRAKNRA
jgi:copper resistance protein C